MAIDIIAVMTPKAGKADRVHPPRISVSPTTDPSIRSKSSYSKPQQQ